MRFNSLSLCVYLSLCFSFWRSQKTIARINLLLIFQTNLLWFYQHRHYIKFGIQQTYFSNIYICQRIHFLTINPPPIEIDSHNCKHTKWSTQNGKYELKFSQNNYLTAMNWNGTCFGHAKSIKQMMFSTNNRKFTWSLAKEQSHKFMTVSPIYINIEKITPNNAVP